MMSFVRYLASGSFLPDNLSCASIDGDDDPLVNRAWSGSEGCISGATGAFVRFNRSEKKNAVLPNNRSRKSGSWNLGFPFDVLLIAPREGWFRAFGDPGHGWTAPGRPG